MTDFLAVVRMQPDETVKVSRGVMGGVLVTIGNLMMRLSPEEAQDLQDAITGILETEE